MNLTNIYALRDPLTNEVKYIGKTNDLKTRIRKHLAPSQRNLDPLCPRNIWLTSLIEAGLSPLVEILEVVPVSEWQAAEQRHIALHRALGADLTNISDGGQGANGVVHSDEARERISSAHKGRIRSEEIKAKIALALKGRVHSDERKAKISEANKGRTHTAETKAKISEAMKSKLKQADR